MENEYLEQRLKLSEDLRHYVLINKFDKVTILEQEIDKLDKIIENL